MRTRLAVATLSTIGLVLATGASSPALAARPLPVQSYIVTVTGNPANVAGLARALGGRVTHVYSSALRGFSVTLPSAIAPALRALPGVRSVETDATVRITSTEKSPPSYGIDRIDQRDLPLSDSYTTRRDGAGVTAYIVDTGLLFKHQEFGGRARSGVDEIDGGGADDCNGHGTHVAGTVGGKTYGVAKGVSLVAVRVLGCDGSGATSGVIAGIDWMVHDHKAGTPAVANMSFGTGASSAVDDAVQAAIDDGITVGVAAGNDAGGLLSNLLGQSDACNSSPGRVPGVLTVAATDRHDARANYSNFGKCVDLFAPGSDIVSAGISSNSASTTMSGTSMATPHVVGAAAIYLAGKPSASPAQVAAAIIGASTKDIVQNAGSATPNRLVFVS